jgi:hypothetical protein
MKLSQDIASFRNSGIKRLSNEGIEELGIQELRNL